MSPSTLTRKPLKYKRPDLAGYQTDILDASERFTVTEAATKTGKTISHISWLLEEALKLGDGQYVWWVAPVFGQSEIAFKRMRNLLAGKGADTFFKANETKLRLTLPTGAEIHFKSAKNPDDLFGEDVHAAVFDEFTRASEGSWHALRSTLTHTRGKCKFIGNVKGKKNWGHKLGLRAKAGEPDYRYFKVTAWDAVDAGILEKEEVEQAQKDLPEAVFKELYLAEPSEDGSNPFGISYIRKNILPISANKAKCYGIDLAKSVDWTVIIGLDDYGQVCHLERFQKDWLQTRAKILDTIGQTPTLIDSTGVGDAIVEELQHERHSIEGFKFTGPSKQQLMEGLAKSIQQGQVKTTSGVLQDELEAFEFNYSNHGVKYGAPEGMHDDCVCALALAVRKYQVGAFDGQYMVV